MFDLNQLTDDTPKRLIQKNYNYYSRKMFSLCKSLLVFYLIVEILLLTAKLYSFDLARCMKEELRPPRNCTIFASDLKARRDSRAFCWVNGFHKARYRVAGRYGLESYTPADAYLYEKLACIQSEKEEDNLIRRSAMLVCGMLLAQIFLYLLQRKADVYRPIIDRLKDRNILDYCPFDRKKLQSLILFAIRHLKYRYFLDVFLQVAYQSMLIALIFFSKLILYGYQPFDDEFALNELLFFPNVSSTNLTTFSYPTNNGADLGIDISVSDQFAVQLDRLYVNSWYVFLGVLAVYCLLLLARLVQYALPTLRTRTILAFIPKVNTADGAKGAQLYSLLVCLNSEIHIFDFLYQLVCSIDQFHFSIILDELDIICKDETDEEELDEVKEEKIEDADAAANGGPLSKDDPVNYSQAILSKDDPAAYPQVILSKSPPSAPNCHSLVNPLCTADHEKQESKSRSHEVITMPGGSMKSTVNVPADVHQHLDRHYSNDDGLQRSDYAHNPQNTEHSNNDQPSNSDHQVHADSNEGDHFDHHSSGVHPQGDQLSDDQLPNDQLPDDQVQ